MHVESVDINPDDATALVQFRDQAAVDFILRSQTLQMKGQTISVQVYEEEKENVCTIEVHGPSDTGSDLDMLLLYFKNKKRSNGGVIVNSSVDTGKNVAYITFKDQEVARRVVDRPEHYLKGQLLNVSLYKPNKKSGNACKDSAPRKILITGLPSSVDKEFVELYFEDFESTCEMQVDNVDINPDDATALVQFRDQAAVDFILRSQTLQMKGQTISVQVYEEEKENACTIEVHGPSDIESDLDMLLLYFKNKKRSNGGVIVNSSVDTGKNVAYITFKDHEVARRVVDRHGHYLKGQLLDVSLYKSKEKCGKACEDSAQRTILLTGLPSSIDKEFLELYFEDFESTCEMHVESVDINPDDATALVKFRDQAAMDFILRSQTLQMKEQTISVQVYEVEKEKFRTIEVHGPSDIESDLERLLLYFKNKKRSDGGVIENSSVDTGKNVGYITFKDQEVAGRVVAKDHSKQGLEVKLVTDRSADDDSTDKNVSTVKVKGVQTTVTKETLEHYFENEKRSGGGPIESIWNDDEDENVVFITFLKSEDARKVVDRRHEIQKCTLQASLYIPPPCYDNKVLIKGLQSTKDALFQFLKATANVEPIRIDYHNEEESTVLVTMRNTPDFEKLEKACKENTLGGARLKVSKIHVSNCILVSNLAPEVTKDRIRYYFENKKKSGGGDVEKVVMNEDEVERTCLVYFEDYKVIDIILDRKHTLGNKELDVKCFQTALGRPEGETDERTFQVPRAFDIKDADAHKVKFVANSPEYCKGFEQELLKHYIKVKWPNDTDVHMNVQLHCMLTKDVKGCFKTARRWEKQAKSVFTKLMDAIGLYRIDVLHDIKPKVIDFLKNTQESEQANVAIVSEKEQEVVVIVGKQDIADDLKLKIEKAITKIEHDAERERQKVTEVFTNLKPIETKMMIFEKFPESLEKEFGDIKIQIAVEKNEIHLQGLISSVRNAKLAIYDKKSKFEIQRIDNISNRVLSLLRLGNTSSSLQQNLQSNGIPAVWEINANGIIVCCSKADCCDKAIELIRTFFYEDTISTERVSVPALETDKWRNKVEEIHAMHPGKVKIALSDDLTEIHVCGTADIGKSVTEEVQSFLRSNTIVTKKVSGSRGVHRFLEKNCKTEIDDISRNLQQYCVTIKTLDQYRGFEIRGPQKGVQEASIQFQKLLNRIQQTKHTVSKPGIAEHIRSVKGKDIIQTIETIFPCVIIVEGDEAYKQRTEKAHGTRTHASCNAFQGTTIYVLQGDMTDLEVGVLVHPSDKNLGFSGGLGKTIISKGGPAIKHECETHRSLNDGDVFMSKAGDLKADYIAHIKSQQWDQEKSMDKDLEATVFKCLQETSKLQEKSVAIPAIGCGVNGFPVNVATSCIVSAIKRILIEYQDSSICEVYLCDMNAENVQGFIDALCKIFGSTTVLLHEGDETLKAGSSSHDNLSGAMGARPKCVATPRRSNNTERNELSQTLSNVPKSEGIAIGNILVTVVKGEIARQKVDVIVNTTSHNLDLRNGAVSQTLLKAAGKELQDEVNTKYPKGLEGIDVAVTDGHKLNCEYVIHTALSKFNDKEPKESIIALHKLMKNCLHEAQRRNGQSIAFPAIGTGNLGYPRNVVAEEMFKAIKKFQANCSQSSIRDVRFIVYQMDSQTIMAFDAEQSRIQKEVQAMTFAGQSDVLGMSASTDEKRDRRLSIDPDSISVTFILYALSSDTTANVIKKLDNSIEKEMRTKDINDHTIRQLQDYQVDEMKSIARQCHVQMRLDKNRGSVKLDGIIENVSTASDKINALLRDAERMELMKNIAQWFYIEGAPTGERVQPYEKDINLTIENAYRQQKDCAAFCVNGIDYILDFASMEEYPERDKTNIAKVMRRDLVKGGTFELPAQWDDMQGDNSKVICLKNGSPEYKDIEQKFKDSAQFKDLNGQLKYWNVVK
ncbi:protein mono-ADP-ribosyltransferase PARP14-like, partial [Mercenaria mercenaria]|uniref:protein mono-ADP-ribosyltransferase PARP14-like n=1 Tax=Mercenaria mercenaria TaxID=6596 RepID=UPI00234FA11D